MIVGVQLGELLLPNPLNIPVQLWASIKVIVMAPALLEPAQKTAAAEPFQTTRELLKAEVVDHSRALEFQVPPVTAPFPFGSQ